MDDSAVCILSHSLMRDVIWGAVWWAHVLVRNNRVLRFPAEESAKKNCPGPVCVSQVAEPGRCDFESAAVFQLSLCGSDRVSELHDSDA